MSLLKKITKTLLMLAAFAGIAPVAAVAPREFKLNLLPFVREQAEETTHRLISKQMDNLNKRAEKYLKVPAIPTKGQLRRQALQDWFIKWEGSGWAKTGKVVTSLGTGFTANLIAALCAKFGPEYAEPSEVEDVTRAASALTILAIQTYIAEKVGLNASFTIDDIIKYVENAAKKQAHSSSVADIKALIRKAVAETPQANVEKTVVHVVEAQEVAVVAQPKAVQNDTPNQEQAATTRTPSMQEFFS